MNKLSYLDDIKSDNENVIIDIKYNTLATPIRVIEDDTAIFITHIDKDNLVYKINKNNINPQFTSKLIYELEIDCIINNTDKTKIILLYNKNDDTFKWLKSKHDNFIKLAFFDDFNILENCLDNKYFKELSTKITVDDITITHLNTDLINNCFSYLKLNEDYKTYSVIIPIKTSDGDYLIKYGLFIPKNEQLFIQDEDGTVKPDNYYWLLFKDDKFNTIKQKYEINYLFKIFDKNNYFTSLLED